MITRLVTATKLNITDFNNNSLLAQSLKSYLPKQIELIVYPENSTSLGEIYNKEIENCRYDPKILLFVHDDVMLLDYFWNFRILEGLKKYDVVGVAGNKRRIPYQPSWGHSSFDGKSLVWDTDENLSGLVAHDNVWPPKIMTNYGELDQRVVQLDGVLLAAKSQTLIDKNVRFDSKFKFHFYDLDFSRTCEEKGLTLGTIMLAICHAGKGNMSAPEYIEMYKQYNEKWENK
jgi:hypothetical protein